MIRKYYDYFGYEYTYYEETNQLVITEKTGIKKEVGNFKVLNDAVLNDDLIILKIDFTLERYQEKYLYSTQFLQKIRRKIEEKLRKDKEFLIEIFLKYKV